MSKPVSIVILAAGLGTRMKSKMAKVLHRAGGRPLLAHVLDSTLQVAPPERIFVVVGHQADRVREAVGQYGVNFVEQDQQKGTGHAVMRCREKVEQLGGRVVVLYGDCPLLSPATITRLIETQASGSTAATLITTRLEDPAGYGRVLFSPEGFVDTIVEQKAATPDQLAVKEINSGIYCFEAEALWRYICEIQPNNPAREYYLTDMPEILNRAGHRVAALHIEDSAELLGINHRVELAAVDRLFRERKVRDLMLAGVTIEKPETVTIDAAVEVGRDTVIEAFAQVRGASVIGEDCRIGACSVIDNSVLEDGVRILPFTLVQDSRIGAGADVGPFARLRMGNEVGAAAHIGNFVELKKTKMGAGAKASHLAYLGDSSIGDKTNIGAGTITCNYDGKNKHRTTIGKSAFIGSNSTLVAPVEIGEESYVGAGSVITEPVPAQALAIGRGRQVVKEGWVTKRKNDAG